MRYSFSTLGCMSASLDDVIRAAHDSGMSGIELRTSRDGTLFGLPAIENAPLIRSRLSAAGIAVTDLAAGITVSGYSPDLIRSSADDISLAAALGAPGIRIFLRRRKGDADNSASVPGIVAALSEMADAAAASGVALYIETHGEFSRGEDVRSVIDLIGKRNVFAIWDVIHTLEYGEDPRRSVEVLSDRLAHVHIKDGVRVDGKVQYLHTDLGKGTVPFGDVLRILEGSGYAGFVSLEWEAPWRQEIRDLYPTVSGLLSAYPKYIEDNE